MSDHGACVGVVKVYAESVCVGVCFRFCLFRGWRCVGIVALRLLFVCVVICGGDGVSLRLILWCGDGCGCWCNDVNVWMPCGVDVVM